MSSPDSLLSTGQIYLIIMVQDISHSRITTETPSTLKKGPEPDVSFFHLLSQPLPEKQVRPTSLPRLRLAFMVQHYYSNGLLAPAAGTSNMPGISLQNTSSTEPLNHLCLEQGSRSLSLHNGHLAILNLLTTGIRRSGGGNQWPSLLPNLVQGCEPDLSIANG